MKKVRDTIRTSMIEVGSLNRRQKDVRRPSVEL